MKNRKAIPVPPAPLLEEVPEEARRSLLGRFWWIFGGAGLLITFLFWFLSQSKPAPNSPETLSQGENSPDAVIEKLRLVSTLQGQKRWELFADSARIYQNQKQAYADNIYAQYYRKDKMVSSLTADKAIINTETNSTEAEGHVELVVENGSKLETDKLNWNQDTDQIKTDSRVHIYKGTDDITAVGLVADTELNHILFIKDVRTRVRDTSEIENYEKSRKFK